MRRKSIVIAAALAAGLGVGTFAYSASSDAQPYGGGWGYMGPGMMGGYGPGWMHGWMHGGYGGGYGPGWCWGNGGYFRGGPAAQSGQATQPDLKLTTDDVKTRMEGWLEREDNPRLKLGDVKEKDADTIMADIVTVDNSLVQRFGVNRHTGFTRPEEGN